MFWVGGRGGCARRCGGERGKGTDHCQLSNLVRPRGFIVHPSKPPSPRHSQHNLSNLPCCCSPSPVPSPSRPPPPNPPGSPPKSDFQKSLSSSANPPTFPLPPKQPSTEPRQIRPERTYLPGPKPLQVRFPPGLFGRLPNAHHLPIILDTSDQTTLPPVLLGCCCLAPGHRPPRPRRSNPRPDTTKNPYSLPGVASFRLQRHFFSLRNLPNSLSFLILRPPPFFAAPAVCCRAVLRCHALPRFSCKTRPLLRVTDPHKVRTTRNRDNLACHHACPRPPRAPSSSSSWGLQTAARKEPSAASRLSPDARASSLSAPRLPPWLLPSPSTTSSSHSLRVTTVFTHQKR